MSRYRRGVDEEPELTLSELNHQFRAFTEGVEPDPGYASCRGRNDAEDAMIDYLDKKIVHTEAKKKIKEELKAYGNVDGV